MEKLKDNHGVNAIVRRLRVRVCSKKPRSSPMWGQVRMAPISREWPLEEAQRSTLD